MEITKDALVRIIGAARTAIKLAEDMQALFASRGSVTQADMIAGGLTDALYFISGEQLGPEQDFDNDSLTMRLLRAKHVSDEEVANVLMKLSSGRSDIIADLVMKHGGYSVQTGYIPPKATAEGEWL